MIKASIDLQDLRRRLYVKAKAEPSWRFWGLYVHVCKMETLRAAYDMAKANNGAPGIDGVSFDAIEAQGVDALLAQLRDELTGRTYQPLPARRREIPKDGGNKVRVLSIPAIRDRVVQGALKLILEPIFEADFQSGSFGYRPKKSAHEAVERVAEAIVRHKTRVIDLDLRSYFDNVRHDRLLAKVAKRVDDDDVMGAADKAESLAGCKSLYRQLPVFGRLAYPERAEATKHDVPGRRSPSCPAAVFAAVGTIRGASKLGGRNITKYLQPRKSSREKSLFAEQMRKPTHHHVGKADDTVEETGTSTRCAAGVGGPASKDRFSEQCREAAVGSRDWLQPARTLRTRPKAEGGESPMAAANEPVRAMTE